MSAAQETQDAGQAEPANVHTRLSASWPWALVLAAWTIALLATWAHQSYLINHDYLIQESGLPWIAALIFFLMCWQVMIAAMMLPSSLLLTSRLTRSLQQQQRLHSSIAAFLAGYAFVWTAFAAAAFLGDTSIHLLVNHWSWLALHPWLIGAVSFAAAGIFQFSPFKQRSLQECRKALHSSYPTCVGASDAWRLGRHHGQCCLGSCWALMLLMFGVGVSNVIWMAVLTGIMVIEKTAPGGRWLSPVVGVASLLLAALWIAHPADLLLTIAG